jgi:predicted acylesterase/phospholipase RssA
MSVNQNSLVPLNSNRYKKLVIGSGGINGYMYLGALYELVSEKIISLEEIDTFSGTSIGSVIGLLLCIGYCPIQIFIKLININFNFNFEFSTILSDFGLFDINILMTHLHKTINEKYGFIPTMSQLYDLTHKSFICNAFNLTRHEEIYFSHKTFPNISCIDAVKASCSVPFLFKKTILNGECFIDGAIFDNLSMRYIDKYFNQSHDNIIGICMENRKFDNSDIFNFISCILDVPVKLIGYRQLNSIIININDSQLLNSDTRDIDNAKNIKYKLFSLGIENIRKIKYPEKIKKD